MVTKTNFDAKLKDLSDRITKNKSKDLLLETFDADCFEGKNYFEGGDGTQNMLVSQVKDEYFGCNSLGNTQYYTWKSKGISNENFYYNGCNIATKLTRLTHVSFGLDQFLFQDASKTTASSVVNVYICYKLLPKTINTDNALKNCLFGAIEAARPNNTKDPDNFIYSGWGIGFDHTETFTHPEGGIARNIIIFGVGISRSIHASNKTEDFLVLGKDLIQMIKKTTIYAEKM